MSTTPIQTSQLSDPFRQILNNKFNILGEFDLVMYDDNFEMLKTHIANVREKKFNPDDKFIIVHHDTDYYMPHCPYGLTIYNLYKTFVELDISLSTVILITNHKGIIKDFKSLIPNNEYQYNLPLIIDEYLSAFNDIYLPTSLKIKEFDTDISHHAISLLGAKRIHRNILFNEFKGRNLLKQIICAYNNT